VTADKLSTDTVAWDKKRKYTLNLMDKSIFYLKGKTFLREQKLSFAVRQIMFI
jgi:hypothetical protein